MFKLHSQALPQRAVEYGITGRVTEIGEDNRVSVGELRCVMKIEVCRCCQCHYRDGSNRDYFFQRIEDTLDTRQKTRVRESSLLSLFIRYTLFQFVPPVNPTDAPRNPAPRNPAGCP